MIRNMKFSIGNLIRLTEHNLLRYCVWRKSFDKKMIKPLVHFCHVEKLSVQIFGANGITFDIMKRIMKFVMIGNCLVRRRIKVEVKIASQNYPLYASLFQVITNFYELPQACFAKRAVIQAICRKKMSINDNNGMAPKINFYNLKSLPVNPITNFVYV